MSIPLPVNLQTDYETFIDELLTLSRWTIHERWFPVV